MRCRGRVPCRAFPNLSRIIKKTRYRITKTRGARPRVRSQLRQRARRTASYSNDPSAAEAPNQVEGFPSLVKQPLHDSTAQSPVQEVFRERRWAQRTGSTGSTNGLTNGRLRTPANPSCTSPRRSVDPSPEPRQPHARRGRGRHPVVPARVTPSLAVPSPEPVPLRSDAFAKRI